MKQEVRVNTRLRDRFNFSSSSSSSDTPRILQTSSSQPARISRCKKFPSKNRTSTDYFHIPIRNPSSPSASSLTIITIFKPPERTPSLSYLQQTATVNPVNLSISPFISLTTRRSSISYRRSFIKRHRGGDTYIYIYIKCVPYGWFSSSSTRFRMRDSATATRCNYTERQGRRGLNALKTRSWAAIPGIE